MSVGATGTGWTGAGLTTVGAMGRTAGEAGATGQRGEPGAGVAQASYDQGLLGNLRDRINYLTVFVNLIIVESEIK